MKVEGTIDKEKYAEIVTQAFSSKTGSESSRHLLTWEQPETSIALRGELPPNKLGECNRKAYTYLNPIETMWGELNKGSARSTSWGNLRDLSKKNGMEFLKGTITDLLKATNDCKQLSSKNDSQLTTGMWMAKNFDPGCFCVCF